MDEHGIATQVHETVSNRQFILWMCVELLAQSMEVHRGTTHAWKCVEFQKIAKNHVKQLASALTVGSFMPRSHV